MRAATPVDTGTVDALTAAFVAEVQADRGGAVWQARDGHALLEAGAAAAAIDDPTQLVALGTIDGAVMGLLRAQLESLDGGGLLAVVRVLYVEPAAREVGVGSALLDRAVEWAAAKGCVGLDALVLPGNRRSKNFFEMHGMVARAITVFRPVGEG